MIDFLARLGRHQKLSRHRCRFDCSQRKKSHLVHLQRRLGLRLEDIGLVTATGWSEVLKSGHRRHQASNFAPLLRFYLT